MNSNSSACSQRSVSILNLIRNGSRVFFREHEFKKRRSSRAGVMMQETWTGPPFIDGSGHARLVTANPPHASRQFEQMGSQTVVSESQHEHGNRWVEIQDQPKRGKGV